MITNTARTKIKIDTYDGSIEEYRNDYNKEKSSTYFLENFDRYNDTEKDFVKSFILNRNSKSVSVFVVTNEIIHFEFFGLTSIEYENGEFSLKTRSCPNE